MRAKLIILLLLLPIMSTAPVSAQTPTAAVAISCSSNQIFIPVYPGANSSGFTICTASNPTTYEEIVELSTSISDNNLSIHTIDSFTIGGNSEFDFYVNVSGVNGMLMAPHSLSVTGNVTSINGLPPTNSASSTNNFIVSILHYDNITIPQNEARYALTFTGLEPPYDNGNLTITVPLFNNGNFFDFAKVGFEKDSRVQWENHNFSISLPLSKVNVAPFSLSSFEVLLSITNETNSSNWTLLENGSKVLTQDFVVFAESDFACKSYGCNGDNSTILIEVYHLPIIDFDDDGVLDDADLCPDTDVGATVDSNGCALIQLDSDSDGIMDDVDECPNTAVGQTVDVTGCLEGSLTDTDGNDSGNNSDTSFQDENESNDDGANQIDVNETTDSEIDSSDNNQEIKPNNPDENDDDSIEGGISDSSSYIIAGSIVFLALVILFVRRKQPPMNEIHSQFGYEESLFRDN